MMQFNLTNWRSSPTLVRLIPFVLFVVLTAAQGQFGEASRYWIYVLKTLAGAGFIWAIRPWIAEMRWNFSWEAIVVGLGVFGLWVGLDGLYPSMDALLKAVLCPVARHLGLEGWCLDPAAPLTPWNPHTQFAPAPACAIVLVRLFGSTLVVPPLEEVFYRSFLYRYIRQPAFDTLPLNYFAWTPFLITAAVFGLAHYEWLPGIFCGMLYQALVIRKNRLGDAITAHAITNFLLGVWVIWNGAWHFW
jgi:uncharacterized protein